MGDLRTEGESQEASGPRKAEFSLQNASSSVNMAWYNILLGKLQVHQHPMMELSSKWLSMGGDFALLGTSNSIQKHFSLYTMKRVLLQLLAGRGQACHNHPVVHRAGLGAGGCPTTMQHGTHNAKVNNQLQAQWVKRLSHKP